MLPAMPIAPPVWVAAAADVVSTADVAAGVLVAAATELCGVTVATCARMRVLVIVVVVVEVVSAATNWGAARRKMEVKIAVNRIFAEVGKDVQLK